MDPVDPSFCPFPPVGMRMEANREEAEKAYHTAVKFLRAGKAEQAERLLEKCIRMVPLAEAEALLRRLRGDDGDIECRREESPSASTTTPETPPRRHRSRENEYTSEQLAAVKKILGRNSKDLYAVLGVEKNAPEDAIKKAFKKAALRLHPDKNPAPGAEEAFKAVSHAFSVLGDSKKRELFDMGAYDESTSPEPAYQYRSTDGLDPDDLTPEELFQWFFYGVPPRHVHRSPFGSPFRRTRRRPQYHPHHYSNESSPTSMNVMQLVQLLPVFVFLMFAIFGSHDHKPLYSMHRSNSYPEERITSDRKVQYYVGNEFKREVQHPNALRKFERSLEQAYISELNVQCSRERRQNAYIRHTNSKRPEAACDELHRVLEAGA